MVDKTVSVCIDGVEPDTPEFLINDMIRNNVRLQLKQIGVMGYTIEKIELV